jgi:hypothetical protein
MCGMALMPRASTRTGVEPHAHVLETLLFGQLFCSTDVNLSLVDALQLSAEVGGTSMWLMRIIVQ